MKIGIVGAGAIGLTFAAALSGVHDVVVLARRAHIADALTRDGIALTSDAGVRAVRVRAATNPRELGDREAIVVAVKAYATRDALAPLRDVLPAHALVASVQNGIDFADDARAALPGRRIVAGSTTQGAIRAGATGVRPVNHGVTTFGRDDTASPSSDDLAAAFASAGLDARVSGDITTVLWQKLVVNAAINALCALTGRTNGAVVDDADLAPLARALAAETAAVARTEAVEIADPWALVEAAARASAANRNSMLQDLDAGRPTEIDAIAGAVARRARAHGVAVPLTDTMLCLLRARERA